MNGEDPWSGWTADWRSGPQETLDFDALERRILRRRRLRLTQWVVDLAAGLLGVVVSLWAICVGSPAGAVTGLAGLALSFSGLAFALGGKYVPEALATRTVAGALAWEVSAARAGIRTSFGGLTIAAGALLFLLICWAAYQQAGLFTRAPSAGYLLAGGTIFALASGAASMAMLRRRRARLRTLEGLLADLKDEA